MKFEKPGELTSEVEVTNVSIHGFWLLIDNEELFLSFEDFPWFKNIAIGELTNVKLESPMHLYWPSLDVDLDVESIRHPEKFPLISQAGTTKGSKGS